MKSTPMDQVRAGDVVAEDLRNDAGGILIGAQTTLTEIHLQRLKTADVATVMVAEAENAASTTQPLVEQRIEALNRRFAAVEDPLLLQLRDLATRRLQSMIPPTNA